MSEGALLLLADPVPTGTVGRSRAPVFWAMGSALAALVLVLAVGVPLFLRMPLWADPIQYDLAARNLLGGGVHYRDVSDVNLPGMVWLHAAIRCVGGWSSETLRLADLLIVGTIVWLLVRWWRPAGVSPAGRTWSAVLLLIFYLSTSELCHCQRDTWLLLPTIGALYLRRGRMERGARTAAARAAVASAVAEGVLWGAAFWIKPHVAVPALACWLLWAVVTLRTIPGAWRCLAVDMGCLLLGGASIGSAGVAWLWWSGAWPYFVESCFVWTRGYYSHSIPFPRRTLDLFERFYPWGLAHLAALPLAIWTVVRAGATPARSRDGGTARTCAAQALLAACYLGWFFQVHLLQLPHEYAWVPPTFLALTLLCGALFSPKRSPRLRLAVVPLVAFTLLVHPMLFPWRLRLWAECSHAGNSALLRDQLTLARNPNRPNWEELEQVAAYLRSQQIQDGELTCNPASTQGLYVELGVQPSTRYVNYDVMVSYFPGHAERIRQELSASRQRFVVSDLAVLVLFPPRAQGVAGDPEVPQQLEGTFPWTEPVAFRTTRYVVHRVTGPVGRLPPGSQVPAP